MQRGHGKDHRPDLQLKLMAAAAETSGAPDRLRCPAGQCADDPLYNPLLQRVRGIVGRQGLLYAGDCRWRRWPHGLRSLHHHDFYLVPLPLTGETATQVEQWITAIVAGARGHAALGW